MTRRPRSFLSPGLADRLQSQATSNTGAGISKAVQQRRSHYARIERRRAVHSIATYIAPQIAQRTGTLATEQPELVRKTAARIYREAVAGHPKPKRRLSQQRIARVSERVINETVPAIGHAEVMDPLEQALSGGVVGMIDPGASAAGRRFVYGTENPTPLQLGTAAALTVLPAAAGGARAIGAGIRGATSRASAGCARGSGARRSSLVEP